MTRGELPGRSARGRSVAYQSQHKESAQSLGGLYRIPVLVEVVLLDLLVVLDGHFCRFSARQLVSCRVDASDMRSYLEVDLWLVRADEGEVRASQRISIA